MSGSREAVSRSGAKRLSLIGQAGAVVGMLAAAGFAVVGLPWLNPEPPAEQTLEPVEFTTPGDAEPDTAPAPNVDIEGIAMRLGGIGNAPKIPEPQPEDDTTNNENDPGSSGGPVTVPTVTAVKYLGRIIEGDRVLALLQIEDQQRIVAAGRATYLPGGVELELEEVEADHIRFYENGLEQTVQRASREGPAISAVSDGSVTPFVPGQAAPNNATNNTIGRSTEIVNTDEELSEAEQRRREAIMRAVEEGRITEERAEQLLSRTTTRQETDSRREQMRRNRGGGR